MQWPLNPGYTYISPTARGVAVLMLRVNLQSGQVELQRRMGRPNHGAAATIGSRAELARRGRCVLEYG